MLKLLALLQDGRFHSGEALGAALGISRAAVWKRLQEMEVSSGLAVHKVRGRGYCLPNPIVLLECEKLTNNPGDWVPYVLDSVDSTNAEAFRRLEGGAQPVFFVVAERQTAGRGRRGRAWVSPFADNIYYSLILRIEGGAGQLDGMSLVVGLAVLAALREHGISGAGLKWPNDVLVSGRKIAGILLEMTGDPADVCHVVVGIGVNVNMRDVEAVDQPWTSMRNELGVLVDRNAFVNSLNVHLFQFLSIHRDAGFQALKPVWEEAHLWQGKNVRLAAGVQHVDGLVLGVDARGALRLLVEGVEHQYSGGELSLRLRDDS
ncbi:MAG: bifunctional biotin--[acetyl-CoA-carboxylase] ligase/biotin operon repressor BirA [Pseudomonas sp.]|uniref:bifunctional biotin--[acetyl-CoA-carboxylase] ligase/biotin operon repressor BirA n=1 Tax=Pseudomonas sp. TaxID=306 RepID=UPI0030F179FF